MSQLIACKNANGIVLATDGMALDFDTQGNMRHAEVKPLIQLGADSAILAGGVTDSIEICHSLQAFLQEENISDIEDIYTAALPFLNSEYESYMRKECEFLPVDPVHHVYFILAGYSRKDQRSPLKLYLLWTKKKLPQIDGDEIGTAYSIPRRMGLEYGLGQLSRDNAPLEDILERIQSNLEKLAHKESDEVAPPFYYARITGEGFRAG
jgi:hypothetical protein